MNEKAKEARTSLLLHFIFHSAVTLLKLLLTLVFNIMNSSIIIHHSSSVEVNSFIKSNLGFMN